MPSIRVKRSRYESLRDEAQGTTTATRPRSSALNNLFDPSTIVVQSPDEESPQSRDSTISARETEAVRLRGTSRPDSSKVHSHILRSSWATTGGRASRYQRGSLPRFEEGDAHGHRNYEQLDDRNHDPEAALSRGSHLRHTQPESYHNEHHEDVVEHLEVIDPQMATVSNLTHTANSVFFPPLPLDFRRPTVALPEAPRSPQDQEARSVHDDALDRHVEDVLDRKQKIKRTLQGVWAFVKTPLGFVFAIYGFMIVFWGAGIVFFLGKIINLHNDQQQGYWVDLTCQVETGLFTLTSVGLIPWRTLDTWRIYWIWHYKNKTISERRKRGIPQLTDPDDLPDPVFDDRHVKVLTPDEQHDLHYQQMQFMKSQTWYRPHGTSTHKAFPITTALWICLLNDGNSIFQIGLCACMWGLNRFERPAATTATLLPAGFLCGIGAAVAIWRGSQGSKKVEVVEERLRDALAGQDGTAATINRPVSTAVDPNRHDGVNNEKSPPNESMDPGPGRT